MSNEQETITNSNESTNTETVEQENQETQQEAQGQENQVATEPAKDRPEWLDAKFETPEQLQNSYNQLQQKFHTRRDEIKEELIREINEEAEKKAPISPADYKIELQSKEGEELVVNDDDPMVDWFRDKAHEYGLDNNEFNELIAEYNTVSAQSGPDWNVESQTLGEHAERRLERVDTWAHSHLSESAYNAFANIPASADMVKCFEELMELNGQPKFNMVNTTEFQEAVTPEDLKAAIADEKYWKNGGDPAHIAKVRQMSAQIARQKTNVN